MGADGVQGANKYGATDVHEAVGRDAFAFTLHYYSGDYTQIHTLGGSEVAFEDDIIADKSLTGLYNGNIRSMITAMQNTSETAQAVHGNVYTYDQLQRIKASDVLRATNGSSVVDWSVATDDNQYDTEYTYDANGNLTNLKRKGNDTGALQMDDFTYHYNAGTNQLDYVSDAATNDATYSTDIDNTQSAGNYDYDEIGQLIADDDEDIYEIKWNTNGKISNVIRTSDASVQSSDLDFYYGPDGQRVMKVVKPRVNGVLQNEDQWTTTYYVRDAAGNVMTTYELSYTSQGGNDYTAHIEPKEQHLYGSKRLGTRQAWSSLHQLDTDAPFTASGFTGAKRFIYTSSPSPNTPTHGDEIKRQLGQKTYELANHLGNVLVTTSDRKLPVETSGAVDYFTADVQSYSDYYPFGMQIPNRNASTGDYRYGFNGMEQDDEVKGSGNSYDFGARMYDSRAARWLKRDKHESSYPSLSPYCFGANNPIFNIDPDGNDILGFLQLLMTQYAQAQRVSSGSETFIAVISRFQNIARGDVVKTESNGSSFNGELSSVSLTFNVSATPVTDGTGSTVSALTTLNIPPLGPGGAQPDVSNFSIVVDFSPNNLLLEDGERIVAMIHEVGLHVDSYSKLLMMYQNGEIDYVTLMQEAALVNDADHYQVDAHGGSATFLQILSEVEEEITANFSGPTEGVNTGVTPQTTDNKPILFTDPAFINLVSTYSQNGVDLVKDEVFVRPGTNLLLDGTQAAVHGAKMSLISNFKYHMQIHKQTHDNETPTYVPSFNSN